MRTHWQKKPLLIRQAIAGFKPLLSRAELFELASFEEVQSRLIEQHPAGGQWSLKQGPFSRRQLPPLKQAGWTLLVQGVDLHVAAVRSFMSAFRFIPQARLDDVMISYATEQGGVGPHFDSYDVFLFQASGRRRWRIGAQKDLRLQEGVPLKILAEFTPQQEFVLEPGDMLYLPPRYAHDGVAESEDCMTYSVGFRAPQGRELMQELLQRVVDLPPSKSDRMVGVYADADQPALAHPAAIPTALQAFATAAVQASIGQPESLHIALGQYLTEPKPAIWFEACEEPDVDGGVRFSPGTNMLYDGHAVYINGEHHLVHGKTRSLLCQLADQQALSAKDVARATASARGLLLEWLAAGWLDPLSDET